MCPQMASCGSMSPPWSLSSRRNASSASSVRPASIVEPAQPIERIGIAGIDLGGTAVCQRGPSRCRIGPQGMQAACSPRLPPSRSARPAATALVPVGPGARHARFTAASSATMSKRPGSRTRARSRGRRPALPASLPLPAWTGPRPGGGGIGLPATRSPASRRHQDAFCAFPAGCPSTRLPREASRRRYCTLARAVARQRPRAHRACRAPPRGTSCRRFPPSAEDTRPERALARSPFPAARRGRCRGAKLSGATYMSRDLPASPAQSYSSSV